MGVRLSPPASIAGREPTDPTGTRRQWYDADAAGFGELSRAIESSGAAMPVVDAEPQAPSVEKLALQAMTDSLTGLGNRAALLHALRRRYRRPATEPLALLAIDVDGLREANRRCGRSAGDDLLRRYAAHLNATVRTGDIVARTGGDEFVILCDGAIDAARAVAARLSGSAVERRSNPSADSGLTTSIGIAARRARERASTLLRRADAARAMAKARGRHEVIEAN